MSIATVYWIHLEQHKDITKEGYIGVTENSPTDRFKQHISLARAGSNITLSKAIRKYGDGLIVTTLLKGSPEYCYLMEDRLRPTERCGWNVVKGGGKPPVNNKPHTDEAKAKIREASIRTSRTPAKVAHWKRQTGAIRSAESRAKMSESNSNRLPWETSRANKAVWKMAAEIYDFFIKSQAGLTEAENHFGLPKYSLKNLYNKFKKQNWNPNDDAKWLSWSSSI